MKIRSKRRAYGSQIFFFRMHSDESLREPSAPIGQGIMRTETDQPTYNLTDRQKEGVIEKLHFQ